MTNPFFNNYNNEAEQKLVEDLIMESISIYGHDMFYIPRTLRNVDDILNESEYSDFTDAIQTEFYIKNFSQFEGDGVFLSSFNIEVRDQLTLTISKKKFIEDITGQNNIITRPREGDLIWIPFIKTAYEIRYVENADLMYQFGKVQSFDLTTEIFEYSQETFNTGITSIDQHYAALNQSSNTFVDITDDSDEFTSAEDDVLDFTEQSPFGEL